MARHLILVVDDEVGIRLGMRRFLEARGYDVAEAGTPSEANRALSERAPDIVLLDHHLPDGDGVDLIPSIKNLAPLAAILMLTAYGTIDLAVRAIKDGAEQFLVKPVDLNTLLVMIERLLENRRARLSTFSGRTRRRRETVNPFVGGSDAILRFRDEVRRLRSSQSSLLIEGATGVGKGVLARWIHQNSPRSAEPFVDLNCAGLSRELLETELFGHEKGAFTGAVGSKLGLIEVAHHGTLFLDEIGDLDITVQPKLLTALEEKRFRRLGDVRDRHSDFRLIAATHHDLASLAHDGRFRLDLYFRISAIPLRIPSLNERREDIPALAGQLTDDLAAEMGKGRLSISKEALISLGAHSWPGNIRELRNVLERAALLAEHQEIQPEHLRFAIAGPTEGRVEGTARAGGEPVLSLVELEQRGIERALAAEQGHVGRAAALLGIPRSTLYKKLRGLGILAGTDPS